MGIDIIIKSDHPNFYASDDPNRHAKWAWHDINWRPIIERCDIEFADYWYDQKSDYDAGDVKNIRDHLAELIAHKMLGELHDDAIKLLAFFEYYVAHNATIYVC